MFSSSNNALWYTRLHMCEIYMHSQNVYVYGGNGISICIYYIYIIYVAVYDFAVKLHDVCFSLLNCNRNAHTKSGLYIIVSVVCLVNCGVTFLSFSINLRPEPIRPKFARFNMVLNNYYLFCLFVFPRIHYHIELWTQTPVLQLHLHTTFCSNSFCLQGSMTTLNYDRGHQLHLPMGLLPDTQNRECACAGNAGNVFPVTAGKQSRHASRHVRHARAVMHAGIAN